MRMHRSMEQMKASSHILQNETVEMMETLVKDNVPEQTYKEHYDTWGAWHRAVKEREQELEVLHERMFVLFGQAEPAERNDSDNSNSDTGAALSAPETHTADQAQGQLPQGVHVTLARLEAMIASLVAIRST